MLGFGFTACTVGPDYQSPQIAAAPARMPLESADVPNRTVEGRIEQAWWKSFRDSELSSLVERLAAQNLDLKTAAERVIRAWRSARS
jgi:outer membrane protein TolC